MTPLLADQRGGGTLPPPTIAPADAVPPTGLSGGSGRTPRGRLGRLFLDPADEPRWARPGLWALLIATGVLYLWNLTASGYANDFYAAAVKAGTQDWKAWLFGSLDSSNAITVDKPPASLWLMVLSARVFGFSSFSLLLPQALFGVGTVATIYAAVRRWSGPAAGLAAGGLLALTPVAALMFRFDNPDAMLIFLMTLAGYFVVRAVESDRGRTALRWLLVAGVAIGFAFLTKMMQGLLVLPAFALAYLVAGRAGLWTRSWHLLAALGVAIVSAGWFVALVSLWPADSRPYVGGSTDNSLWELAIGYNGLSRIFGGSGNGGAAPGGAVGGIAGGGNGFGGSTGLLRMFSSSFGTEISWLIPAALIGLVAGLWFTRRFPRTDRTRAGLLLWGGSMIVTALVFSFMSGTIHPYYAVALAPSIAAVVAIAGNELWRGRSNVVVRSVLALMIAVTGIWSFVLLGWDASWLPWLRWVVLFGSIVGAALLVASIARLRRLAVIGLLVGSLTALGGTTAFAIATAATSHSGSIPTSGPTSSAMGGVGDAAGFGGGTGGIGRDVRGAGGTGTAPEGTMPDGSGSAPDSSGTAPYGTAGAPAGAPTGVLPGGTTYGAGQGGFPDGASGIGSGAVTNTELIALLNATDNRWSAAVSGSQTAAGYILATDTAVMAIGGWSGDPAPTLAQFQQHVADGDIGYYIAGVGQGGSGQGGGGQSGGGQSGGGQGWGGQGGGGTSSNSEIQAWVEANFTASTVGGTTVYDLTSATTG